MRWPYVSNTWYSGRRCQNPCDEPAIRQRQVSFLFTQLVIAATNVFSQDCVFTDLAKLLWFLVVIGSFLLLPLPSWRLCDLSVIPSVCEQDYGKSNRLILLKLGIIRVTTCLENLEMSGNLTAVRDFNNNQGNVTEKILSGKSCLKLFIVSCVFASIHVFSLFCVKYKIYGFGSCTVAVLLPPLTVTLVWAWYE